MPEATARFGGGPLQTTRRAIAALSEAFRAAGIPTPELDARLLVLAACGLSPEAYLLRPNTPLSKPEEELIQAFAARRVAREPVSRVVGYREFWGRRFVVGPAVLDPRPDTETLIEAALSLLGERRSADPLRILDLGTGSGCLLLTLLAEMPGAWGVGSDISLAALNLARLNAKRLGVASRAAFVQSDWCETFAGPFGLIISNPPYIEGASIDALEDEVRCYDPKIALYGGMDGLAAYRRIIGSCARIAEPGAWVVLEAGMGQASRIAELFTDAGWEFGSGHYKVYRDLSEIHRVVAIKRQA